jgi:hypothetical protein
MVLVVSSQFAYNIEQNKAKYLANTTFNNNK